MNMKSFSALLAALLLSGAAAQAALYDSGFANGGVIPDGNPTGWSDTRTVSGLGPVLSGITVTINLSGGFNGDLRCYLNYGSSSVTLLNRLGSTPENPFGSATAGFTSFVFSDSGLLQSTISASSGALTGTYQAATGSFDSSFHEVNPNGAWTISFFDMAGGNDPSTLTSWRLDITAVPEPVNVAMGIFAGVTGLTLVVRRRGSLKKLAARVNTWLDAA